MYEYHGKVEKKNDVFFMSNVNSKTFFVKYPVQAAFTGIRLALSYSIQLLYNCYRRVSISIELLTLLCNCSRGILISIQVLYNGCRRISSSIQLFQEAFTGVGHTLCGNLSLVSQQNLSLNLIELIFKISKKKQKLVHTVYRKGIPTYLHSENNLCGSCPRQALIQMKMN